jgi:subtilase family serine protease
VAPDRITGSVSGQMVPLARSLHPRAQPKYDQGAVDPQSKFGYVTLLTSPSVSQQKALDKLMAEQQDPSSPNYRKWLTPAQYADRFGLSQSDIDKITTWLKAQGFTVISVGGGRNSIIFSGTAIEIEAAFQTQIHRYNIGGEEHFANATAVKIPAAWSGVVTGVRGLNSFLLKPMNAKRRLHRDYYSSALTSDFMAPGDIATLYDINSLYAAGTDGTGQKLAIIGQTDIYLPDVNDFRSGFALSQIPFSESPTSGSCTINSSGLVVSPCTTTNLGYVLVGNDPGTTYSCGDLTEADNDIEWSGATARNAQIIYVNSPIVYDTNCNYVSGGGVEAALSAAINPPSGPPIAPVISMSYGACELDANLSDETELQQGNVEGVTILNSSGDTGAAECDPNETDPWGILATGGTAVSYPASSVYVTGVGGTAIPWADFTTPGTYWGTTNGTNGGSLLPPPAPRVPEEAWNDDFEFAAYCTANSSTSFCTYYGFGNPTTALQVQEAFGQAAAVAGSGNGIGAGGGGVSNCATFNESGQCTAGFPQPSWQTVTIPGQASARFVPDVSLLASPDWPGYIICTELSELGLSGTGSACAPGGPAGIANALALVDAQDNPDPPILGGTSVSTPIFAGIVALLNQYLGTPNGVGNINPVLYQLAVKPNNSFNQLITGDTGNNQVFCVPGDPSIQSLEAGLICPGTGVLGFLSSNADTATGYNLATGLGSVDAYNLAVASKKLLEATITALVASPTQIFLTQSVTLTATLTPSSATGTVSFYDNGSGTPLGSATLSGGVGTFSTTALPLGANSIVATYSGDDESSSSSAATVTVLAAPTFTLSTPSTPASVLSGESTTSTFTVTPGGGTFAAAVTFACNNLDATVSCSFNPTQIALGAGATPVTVTITTAGPNTSGGSGNRRRKADNRSPWLPLALPLAGIVMAGFAGRRVSKYSAIAGLCVSLVLLGLLLACGGSKTPVAISVSPSGATVWASDTGWPPQTATFNATVTNTTNTAVTWAVNTTNGGSITSGGVYTAPTAAEGLPASATITATSQADSTKTASATVTITPTTVPGSYPITVTATEGPTVNTTSAFTLTVH